MKNACASKSKHFRKEPWFYFFTLCVCLVCQFCFLIHLCFFVLVKRPWQSCHRSANGQKKTIQNVFFKVRGIFLKSGRTGILHKTCNIQSRRVINRFCIQIVYLNGTKCCRKGRRMQCECRTGCSNTELGMLGN